ncbi:MAG: ribonuclease P protein component [Sphingobacteriales bacterium]|nr:ribonuclease P protein component [Sphingobacteriales bacterium]
MAKQFTLGKRERLKSRKAIDLLFREGQRFSQAPIRVFYRETGTPGLQFGVAVSAKIFKKAVDRNRVKRLLREAWRLQKNELAQQPRIKDKGLHLFFIYTDRELPDFDTLYKITALILQKLNERLNG